MLDKIDDALGFQKEAMRLRAYRQEILSSNIANADTPGYRARDIDFASELKKAVSNGQSSNSNKALSLSLTAKNHIPAQASNIPHTGFNLLYRIPDQPSADGNTVDMDRERINFADNSFKYQADINFVNGRIRSMMSVLQQ